MKGWNRGAVLALGRERAAPEPARYAATLIGEGQVDVWIPYALNDLGWVVGGVEKEGREWPFRWRPGERLLLPGGGGVERAAATAVNRFGHAVGWAMVGDRQTAFLWNDAGLHRLGMPFERGADRLDTLACDVNDHCEVAGAADGRAAVWQAGRWHLVRDAPAAGCATAINSHGDLAGVYYPGPARCRAFLWSEGRFLDLGSLGGKNTEPTALNDRGEAAGHSEVRVRATGRVTTHAFLWTRRKIRDLTPQAEESAARAMNDRGEVVGYLVEDGRERAVLWRDGRTVDLTTCIGLGDGWLLERATAINNHGQIAGYGRLHGCPAAFLLTPA